MTGKEALEKISWRYVNEPSFQEWCNIVKQELEKLEKENKELKELNEEYFDGNALRTIKINKLQEENVKQYEKAIEILKEVCSLNCDKTLETERHFLQLTQEEYELLKEVLGND